MKKIPLTQGYYAIIDTDDFKVISKHKWHFHRSRVAGTFIGKKHIWMHRLITNAPKGMDVDHINGNGLDNRKSNLRVCTHQQNCWNKTKLRKNKLSKYQGVSWNKQKGKWLARIQSNGETHFLGWFTNEKKAGQAYDAAAANLFGEFAFLNMPNKKRGV